MKPVSVTALALTLAIAAGGGGYLLGQKQGTSPIATLSDKAPPPALTGNVASKEQPGQTTPEPNKPTGQDSGSKKIRFYRNPMGLPDTSPTPKKDSMGMDYIAVYEGEDQDEGGTVKVSLDKVQKLGVRTEAAAMRKLERVVRATGSVQVDERRQQIVSTRFEGWIERLHVNTTGQAVKRGEPLMEAYSPELVLAQQEYVAAITALRQIDAADSDLRSSVGHIAAASLQKLGNLAVPESFISTLKRDGTVRRSVTIPAPVGGVVLKKNVIQGARFMPGDPLFEIVDLSNVWLVADVFEQDLRLIRDGQAAQITVNSFPGVTFHGTVGFIYPAVARETRTGRVRIEVPNPDGRLRADMYATVEISTEIGTAEVVTVPASAVLDSGMRQAVLVERGEGRYEPRAVKVGARSDNHVEILDGLKADEKVVISANFLIDAESNLRAALSAFTQPGPNQENEAKSQNTRPGSKP